MPPTRSRGEARRVRQEPRQYMVAKQDDLQAMMFGAFVPLGSAGPSVDFESVVQQLNADPDVAVVRTIAPQSLGLLSNTPSPLQRVVVARMAPAKATELGRLPGVILEEDALVALAPVQAPHGIADPHDPSVLIPFGVTARWDLRIVGPRNEGVEGASVYLYGSGVPVQGVTDATGNVSLTLMNESQPKPRALYVNPRADYWSLWVDDPELDSGAPTPITLEPLSAQLQGLPRQQVIGWGERSMRLDQLPPQMRGAGVRVAVIDSGAALSHPDLADVAAGLDLTVDPPDADSWSDDSVAHGSHCTGIVAGRDDGFGIRGFAPDAEIHAIKIFPGGRLSSLLDALDYCLTNQIDLVNMSLGTGQPSQLILQKIAQAKQQGIACIVAAGNSGDAVQFPGSSPDVLTVAAIGRVGEFPEQSFHARQVWAPDGAVNPPTTVDGFFAAKFSCHGPEVDVAGPGVAVLSSVPAKGFAAWDGTSMATPHITGLAALTLAHHPDFTGPYKARDAARVERLFEIIRQSATPMDIGDVARTGAGLPDAPRALGLDAPVAVTSPIAVVAQTETLLVRQMLADLQAAMAQVGLA